MEIPAATLFLGLLRQPGAALAVQTRCLRVALLTAGRVVAEQAILSPVQLVGLVYPAKGLLAAQQAQHKVTALVAGERAPLAEAMLGQLLALVAPASPLPSPERLPPMAVVAVAGEAADRPMLVTTAALAAVAGEAIAAWLRQ